MTRAWAERRTGGLVARLRRRLDPARRFGRVLLASVAAMAAAGVSAAAAEDPAALRVCADPSNLPFSNRDGEGFENKIVEVLAGALGVPLQYTWFPQSIGFVRNTIRVRKCDLVAGIPLGYELLQNTDPYYRSTYALIYRADSGLGVSSLDDPLLADKRLGVIAGTPPATLMARYGLLARSKAYHLLADTRHHHPARQMARDVAEGALDAGVLWGPIAGYYAQRTDPPLSLAPLAGNPGDVPLDFRIAMGVRFREPEWKARIDELIRRNQPAINAVLHEYGVPLLDDRGRAIAP